MNERRRVPRCSCIAINHDHPKGGCVRSPLSRYGDCRECHHGLVIRRAPEGVL